MTQNANNHLLTRRERRLLRKQEREKGHQRQLRGQKIKKAVAFGLVAFFLIGGVVWGIVSSLQSRGQGDNNSSGTPKLEINHSEYDAGDVKIAGGLIKHTYELKNNGDGNLLINSIWTSCHCTTARLIVSGKKSSEFGMDKRSTSQKIAPGKTGSLEVTFDPAYHGPAGIGEAVRAVYLSTNDPQNKKAEVRLIGTIVP